ncbi:SET domain-containing protein-lysine N-methyltransferase, partial [Candidatus Bathyarchaeota archaeon]|nr:SET domain-containing protein-lysine N-methyltransferase [Candidatus Bathyarchaeota archaeon]
LVDHPSDLVVTDETQYHGQDAAAAEKLAKKCKAEGNTALKKQDLAQAYRSYTEGLKIAKLPIVTESAPGLARDICRNRALVNILLNQLDEAKADAQASLIGGEDQADKELDAKAYSRAGTAAYNLGNYEEARAFFEEQLKLTPGDKVATANLKRIDLRLGEQETGEYNMKKIRAALSTQRPGADAATFTGSTEVKDSPGRGRGLFASRDIPPGALIMAEKAFCVTWAHDDLALTAMTYDVRDDRIRVSPAGLTRAVVQRLLMNPSQMDRVFALHGDYQGDGKDVRSTEDGPVVDVFRVHDTVSRNGFGLASPYGNGVSTGIWTRTAFINHSCVSNSEKEFVGDLIVIRASKPIAKGEEILHNYIEAVDHDERQSVLMSTWGFNCECELCKAEQADSADVWRRRRELAGEADEFVVKESCVGATKATVARARKLERAIGETYDEKRFKGLPRVGTNRIREWLAQATPRR